MHNSVMQLTYAVAAAIALAGCGGQDSRVPPLEAKIAELEKQVEQLEFQIRFQSQAKDWDQVAYLTPGSDGYAVVKMDLGYLTVNLANTSAYANGIAGCLAPACSGLASLAADARRQDATHVEAQAS